MSFLKLVKGTPVHRYCCSTFMSSLLLFDHICNAGHLLTVKLFVLLNIYTYMVLKWYQCFSCFKALTIKRETLALSKYVHSKYHTHINNICSSSLTNLGIMRTLKFTFKRNTLNQIYISFLRPILEYSSVLWDNCSKYEKHRLERMHLEAARIVTGTTPSISTIHLYDDIGWLTLEDRRNYQKSVLTYIYIYI